MTAAKDASIRLAATAPGIWRTSNARIIDRSGKKRLSIGDDGFVTAMRAGVLVDKTMLVADVLESGYKAMLFCRPRRFGKTLNMTMLKAFFETPDAGLSPQEADAVFTGTEVWEAERGRYRAYQGAYPVVHVSFNTAKRLGWPDALAEMRGLIADEYLRHAYLRCETTPLSKEDIAYFNAVAGNKASDADMARSLAALCRMLRAYHKRDVVVLIDEYDAPVMAGYTNGYYDEVVSFLKGWLTGALKDGGAALAFACLTGVQRISKESVFSDLNNLYVSTPLTERFDERYGFTDAEVEALAAYLGHPGCMQEARCWYDGYRFGSADVYNPWSVINYLNEGCSPGIYWGNTSSNSVLGDLVAGADAETLGSVYTLLAPGGGAVEEPLDLGVVFPDIGIREGALWSMLYLSGYLTTDDTRDPNDGMRLRPLRVPDHEVARLFEDEVLRRFRAQAGGARQLMGLQKALLSGDEEELARQLEGAAERASTYDLVSELACHMLVMGLLFGMPGYENPVSNREGGRGRYDIRVAPAPRPREAGGACPLITIEIKYFKPAKAPSESGELGTALQGLARAALAQIADKGYDARLPDTASGRLRWGIAFCGKRVGVACERLA